MKEITLPMGSQASAYAFCVRSHGDALTDRACGAEQPDFIHDWIIRVVVRAPLAAADDVRASPGRLLR
jgi:hypothetical protein